MHLWIPDLFNGADLDFNWDFALEFITAVASGHVESTRVYWKSFLVETPTTVRIDSDHALHDNAVSWLFFVLPQNAHRRREPIPIEPF